MKAYALIAGILMSFSLNVHAADQQNCLDESLVNEIRQHIQLQTVDVDKFDRCDPSTDTYKILEALSLVKTIAFDESSLGKPFNQDILPTDFWGYFSQRANTIVDEDDCQKNVLAYVFGWGRDGVVHVCQELYDARITKFERAETMLHEVRHFEGYGHVTCTRGPRDGQAGACDDSIDEKGSYAVTVESLTKMALKAKDVPRMQKAMISVLALTYGNETFNIPIQARDLAAFYLVGNDGKGYIYSDKGLIEVRNLGDDTVISRTNALAVFPADKSDAYTADVFTTSLAKSPAMGTFSADYNDTPTAQRPKLIDIMNLGYISASITEKEVKATLKDDDSDTPVELPWAATAVYSGQEYGTPDKDSLYVTNGAGEMYRLQFSEGHQYTMNQVDNKLKNFKAVSVFNDGRLALDASGKVLVEENGSWKPFEALKGQAFSKMTRPFLWDQYFEDNQNQNAAL